LPRIERLAILLGLVAVGLGIAGYVPLRSPVLAFRPPGTLSIVTVTLAPARQVGLVVVLLGCAAVDGIMRGHRRLAGAGLAYGLAFAACLVLRTLPFHGLLGIALVALLSSALALELLASPRASTARTWGRAALVGLMMGEVAWALSPGVIAPHLASFILLLVFYGLTGILQQHIWGRLRPQVVIEFLVVGGAALALVVWLAG
jgi:hypothetical protein